MGSLTAKAKRLREAAEKFEQKQAFAKIESAFQTRIGQIEPLKAEVHRCYQASKLLRNSGAIATVPEEELRQAVEQLQELLVRYDENPEVIAEPNAIDFKSIRELINKCLEALEGSWIAFVSPPGESDPLVEVLSRFESLRSSASELLRIRVALRETAKQLPKSKRDVTKVVGLKKKQGDTLNSLSASGLNEEVEDFLKRASTGVPLAELIARPKLLKWIKDQNLLNSFTVRG